MRALKLADLVIEFSKDLKNTVDNERLQLVIYLLSVIYLVENGHSLFSDEYFSLHKGLPVEPVVYFEYENFGRHKIKEPITHVRVQGKSYQTFEYTEYSLDEQMFVWKYLQVVLRFSTKELKAMIAREPQFKKKTEGMFVNIQLTKRYWSNHVFWEVK